MFVIHLILSLSTLLALKPIYFLGCGCRIKQYGLLNNAHIIPDNYLLHGGLAQDNGGMSSLLSERILK